MKKMTLKEAVLILLLIVIVALLLPIIFMWLWNWLMTDIFDLQRIGYLQSFGLMLLIRLATLLPNIRRGKKNE